MSNEEATELASEPQAAGGFLTQVRDRGLSPALLAEQQRAKSEIEAALTIAANMPRDEKRAMDGILVSCQRKGLAAKAQYQYSRGGTPIYGPSIVLMEAIAQRWGNIDFGFRELSRYPGRGGLPGESVVEAYAWDLESNTRRKVVFQVEHAMMTNKKKKILTDPRDIYEYVANQAQRRVRTCLENIIPRDIVDSACEECDRTLKAEVKDIAEATAKMLAAFSTFGVTQGMIEGRIQRRIDAITPAQIIGMKKIYASLRDGMSEVADWFDVSEAPEGEKPQTAIDKAKAAMREKAAEAGAKAPPVGTASTAPAGGGQGTSAAAALPPVGRKPAGKSGSAKTRQEKDPEKVAGAPAESLSNANVQESNGGSTKAAPSQPAAETSEPEPDDPPRSEQATAEAGDERADGQEVSAEGDMKPDLQGYIAAVRKAVTEEEVDMLIVEARDFLEEGDIDRLMTSSANRKVTLRGKAKAGAKRGSQKELI